jgi:hypothetical protein
VPVAQATTAADGTFSTYFGLSESMYRARVEPLPETGLATGFSRPLTVVFRRTGG